MTIFEGTSDRPFNLKFFNLCTGTDYRQEIYLSSTKLVIAVMVEFDEYVGLWRLEGCGYCEDVLVWILQSINYKIVTNSLRVPMSITISWESDVIKSTRLSKMTFSVLFVKVTYGHVLRCFVFLITKKLGVSPGNPASRYTKK